MSAPRVETLQSVTSLRVMWDPIVEWNERGGLEITAYYVYRREQARLVHIFMSTDTSMHVAFLGYTVPEACTFRTVFRSFLHENLSSAVQTVSNHENLD